MRRGSYIAFFLGICTLTCCTAPLQAADEGMKGLAHQARAILQKHCHRCHGQDGTVEGGMSYVLDRERLVARGKIVPGSVEKSPLLRRVEAGKMPPPGETPRPSVDEIAVLKKWVEGGAPAAEAPTAPRQLLSHREVQGYVLADLEGIERRSRRFARYFSIAPQYNAGLSDSELQSYRIALTQLLNSLSWHPRISTPKAVDPAGVVLRIDLRDLLWDANSWDRILAEYPYGVAPESVAARACMIHTRTRLPVIRADWFLATACRPPLYHDLLQLPTNAAELERQLRVDVTQDIQQERVARAGFNGSGVARNNRILERHDSILGAYWRTYDFEAVPQNLQDRDNLLPDRRNIFAYPLGPGAGDNTFQHAGGEIIFTLPNGLQGYMLINAVGVRVDKAPAAVVSDPKRPDRQVETGISCMSCHVQGINPKSDQVRDHLARNARAFSKADAEQVRALYVPEAKMKAVMDADAERYRRAVEKCGGRVNVTAPITTLTQRYEADIDLPTAAAELGLKPESFLAQLSAAEELTRGLGALKLPGGTVHRPVWVQAFADVARALRLGIVLPTGSGQRLPDNTGEVDPLEAQSSPANGAAFSPDGSRALFASADRSLRLWNVEAGRDIRRFIGHTASVWCVAISPDGKRALSGSADRTVRLWDINTGRELRRLAVHEELVSAVAFSPDGQRALSAGFDPSVILWDLETGRALRSFANVRRATTNVLFTRDATQMLVCSGTVPRLVNLSDGHEVHCFEGHNGNVTAAAFSPDGTHLLSCDEDGFIRLWETATGRAIRTMQGHVGAINSVAFSADGRTALSGGADRTVRLWDVETGKELKRLGEHKASLVAVAFSPDWSEVLSCSRDAAVRNWLMKP
jgi:mono/diheme cytochrome c family protein